jgi:hypothetical protein
MEHSGNLRSVNTRGWKKLARADLERLILEFDARPSPAISTSATGGGWIARAHLRHAPEVPHA